MNDQIVVALITSLVGGLLVALVNHWLTRGKLNVETEKIRMEVEKLAAEAEKIRVETAQLKDQSEKAKQSLAEFQERVQERSFEDYSQAFEALEKRMRESIQRKVDDGEKTPTISLKLIAVAMTFSWENVILTRIPRVLKEFPAATINLDVVFVAHQFLEESQIDHTELVDWADISKRQMSRARSYAVSCNTEFNGHLRFTARVYRNLPHWHGWLVDDEHLFLGRTNWAFPKGGNRLLVGQNLYRYFNKGTEGSERIDLFQNWHQYYVNTGVDVLASE